MAQTTIKIRKGYVVVAQCNQNHSGNRRLASEQFRRAVEANSKYVHARIMLGVLLLSSGDREQACQEFEEVLAIDPGNRSAKTYLRIARGQSGQDTDPHE